MRAAFPLAILCLFGAILGSSEAKADSKFLLRTGDVGAIAVPLAAGIVTYIKEDDKGFEQLFFTYGTTIAMTFALKKTIDSTRPNGLPESFPSAHAASAFAGAAYLQRRYGWDYAIPAYAASLLVSYSRVENHKHRWGDIAGSLAISNIAAYFLTDKLKEEAEVAVIADPATKTYGIAASLHF